MFPHSFEWCERLRGKEEIHRLFVFRLFSLFRIFHSNGSIGAIKNTCFYGFRKVCLSIHLDGGIGAIV